jgi:hypothetical protein
MSFGPVRDGVHADRHIARVQQQHRPGQLNTGCELVGETVRPHDPLAIAVFGPKAAVTVIGNCAGPDPAVVSGRSFLDVGPEPFRIA